MIHTYNNIQSLGNHGSGSWAREGDDEPYDFYKTFKLSTLIKYNIKKIRKKIKKCNKIYIYYNIYQISC